MAARRAELLSVPNFHNVFSLPHGLSALILAAEDSISRFFQHVGRLPVLSFTNADPSVLDLRRAEQGATIGGNE